MKHTSWYEAKNPVYKQNGESRELPLNVLMERQIKLAQFAKDMLEYPVFIDEGAVTRTMAEKNKKEHAMRDNKIKTCMPSTLKHLEALPLMLAEAEKQDAGADALWTMQCNFGCPAEKENMKCVLGHPQHFVCHPCWTPQGSPCSD